MKLQVQIKETELATIVIVLLFVLSIIFGYFVSWQIGIPAFIFGLSLAVLHKLQYCLRNSVLCFCILGIVFIFTVYSPIHEAIHLFFAHVSGVPVSKVVWWFLTDSGIQTPRITIPTASKNVLLTVTPFLLLSMAFITLWYMWYIRKSPWMHFAYISLPFNFALSCKDLGLSPIVALAISSIALIPYFIRAFFYFQKLWKKQS